MEAHSFARADGGLALPRSRKLLSAFKDERLVAQLRRGNDVAFEVLFDRHHAGVLSYCRHMLGSRDEAEDALQQSFVSAHADIVGTDKPISFKAWIFTIARNRCLSILRARREQPTEHVEHVSTAGLGEEVEHRAELKELLADMQELPEDQRAALILSELGDLSHAEVAQVIDCEVGKVKSLVFQARSGLMERRQARETPCEEIREQLATLRGGSLRRGPLRRHLKACPGCAEFRVEVRRQRQAVAAVLPVVPTLALRDNALAAVGISASTAGGGVLAGGGAGAVIAAKTGVAKVAVIAAATTTTVGGAVAIEKTVDGGPSHRGGAAQSESSAGGTAVSEQETGVPVDGVAADPETAGERGAGTEQTNGFEPVQGESNGERARDFAAGRGQGNHTGIAKQQQEIAHGGSNPNAGPNAKQNPATPRGAGPQNDKPHQNSNADSNPKPELIPGLDLKELLPPPGERGKGVPGEQATKASGDGKPAADEAAAETP
jgi:RNA polymerase sigma factor (sigma-70 family)